MKHPVTFLAFAFILALILALAGGQAAHADSDPVFPPNLPILLIDDGDFFPIHGPGDLMPFPFKDPGHPNACTPPLVLNSHGQCALPGDETPPDPIWHRIGF